MDENKTTTSLKIYSPNSIELTLEAVCFNQLPSLLDLANEYDEFSVKSEITKLLANAQLALNIGKPMNEVQCIQGANFIYDVFKLESMETIRLAFQNGLAAKYGQIFDRFDVQVVCDWINKTINSKLEFMSGRPILTHEQLKHLKKIKEITPPEMNKEGSIPMPPEVKESLSKMFRKHGVKEPFKKGEKKDNYLWPEPKDEFEKECLDVFNEKWKTQGETKLIKQDKPYIMFNEVMYSPDSWLTYCYKLKMEKGG